MVFVESWLSMAGLGWARLAVALHLLYAWARLLLSLILGLRAGVTNSDAYRAKQVA